MRPFIIETTSQQNTRKYDSLPPNHLFPLYTELEVSLHSSLSRNTQKMFNVSSKKKLLLTLHSIWAYIQCL